MFKNLSFFGKYWLFRVSADTQACGAPLSATSVAIVIIPNLAGMFNEKTTFFKKMNTDFADLLKADLKPQQGRKCAKDGKK